MQKLKKFFYKTYLNLKENLLLKQKGEKTLSSNQTEIAKITLLKGNKVIGIFTIDDPGVIEALKKLIDKKQD